MIKLSTRTKSISLKNIDSQNITVVSSGVAHFDETMETTTENLSKPTIQLNNKILQILNFLQKSGFNLK